MKSYFVSMIVLLLFTCKGDKTIAPQDYDGEYPYVKRTGTPINTYSPQYISGWQVSPTSLEAVPIAALGQYSFLFKGHTWNHWPYMNVSFRMITNPSPPFDRIGNPILGVNVTAMSEYNCAMESISFIIPAKMGSFHFGQQINYDTTNPAFQDIDCDASKDQIVANTKTNNWVTISKLDTISNQVEGSFDLSFIIAHKDTTYSLIYPTNIQIQGNFTSALQKR